LIYINFKGGIGNQCFQYALGRAIQENGYDVRYDIRSFQNYRHSFRLDFFNTKLELASETDYLIIDKILSSFKIKSVPFIGKKNLFPKLIKFIYVLYNWVTYVYKPVIKDNGLIDKRLLWPKGQKYYDGYWAKPCLFNKKSHLLKAELCLKEEHFNEDFIRVKQKIVSSKVPYVAIHVRRGDYLDTVNSKIFFPLGPDYYNNAINYFKNKFDLIRFIFFSNDLTWCKQNFPGDFEFMDESVELLDFHEFELIKLCKHQIIANSTFSWWAAWLNENEDKIVIAPEKWYTNPRLQAKYRKGNLIPDSWIKL
jgi:hypothetical protein